MTAKEFLRGVRFSDRRLQAMAARAEHLRELAEKITGDLDAIPGGHDPSYSRVESCVVALADLYRELGSDIDQYKSVVRQARSMIDTLTDPRYRTILELRYLVGLSWKDVAKEVHYDEAWVHRLHGWALSELEKASKSE